MASLSDQIDRLSRNTRALAAAATAVAPPTASTAFTRAVLSTHLGDLIRDRDPSELGLFRLVPNASAYPSASADPPSLHNSHVRRAEFSGATPLRRNPARSVDQQEIQPEVYAHAALKYIDQYEPVRPMPRAYDQIVAILGRLNAVRANINSLNATLEETPSTDKEPSVKSRVADEERRIKDLQARIVELSKLKKQNTTQLRRPTAISKPARAEPTHAEPPKAPPKAPLTPGSPQEDKFWATKGEPSRTLRFSENLLEEEVPLGDISSTSFGSPLAVLSSQIPNSKMLGFGLNDDPTITRLPPLETIARQDTVDAIAQPTPLSLPETPPPAPPLLSVVQTPATPPPTTSSETPSTRQRRVKVNVELERIVTKIWATVSDIIAPNRKSSPLSVPETITYLEQLSIQTPAPESPIASSASSITADGGVTPPNTQQVQYAFLLTMLLSASPHYAMPLQQVKEHMANKAKSSGMSGQEMTRVLYGCVAKRLVKFDRGGREQIVKFDI